MAGNMKRVVPGDRVRFDSKWYNAVTDNTRDGLRSRALGRSSQTIYTPGGLVLIGNGTGDRVGRSAIIGIDAALIPAADNLLEYRSRVALVGSTPTKANHTGNFVITAEPIPKNGIGYAYAFGVCRVQVNILLDGDDTADVANSDGTQLESGPIGSAQILECESGAGTKWATVRLSNGSLPTFPVTLSNSAGFAGNNDPPAPPSLPYTVHHAKTGRFIADTVAVWPARQLGHVTPATKGYCDLIGNVTYIVQHDEVIDGGACA